MKKGGKQLFHICAPYKKKTALVQKEMYSLAPPPIAAPVGCFGQARKVKPVGLSTNKTEAAFFPSCAEQFSKADIIPTQPHVSMILTTLPLMQSADISSCSLRTLMLFIQHRFTVHVRKVISGATETVAINPAVLRCKDKT